MNRSPYRRLKVFLTCTTVALVIGGSTAAAKPFPAGPLQDEFRSSSGFRVTINGVEYPSFVEDLETTVGRSDVTTEDEAGPVPVEIMTPVNCVGVCSPTVSDADIDCWPIPWGGPDEQRELHTEMVSLNMCGPLEGGGTICYLAGQPAWEALNPVSAAGNYRNSYGEIESLNMEGPGNPDGDLPARSFWVMRGVVTIDPAPTVPVESSGVYYASDPILMSFGNVQDLPPSGGTYQNNDTGNTMPDGSGMACGLLPVALFDADGDAPVGFIHSDRRHRVGFFVTEIPVLTQWGLIALTLLFIALAIVELRRRRARA